MRARTPLLLQAEATCSSQLAELAGATLEGFAHLEASLQLATTQQGSSWGRACCKRSLVKIASKFDWLSLKRAASVAAQAAANGGKMHGDRPAKVLAKLASLV